MGFRCGPRASPPPLSPASLPPPAHRHDLLVRPLLWVQERPLAMTTERPACGLGSLLSMSCRDRAEAFARRLQSRLQNLGLGSSDEPPPAEPQPSASPPGALDSGPASAPAPGPGPAPTDGCSAAPPRPPPRPPLRLGSSSDSDLYYDFDLESPASPAEEALELVVAQQPRGAPAPASAAAPAPVPAPAEPESGITSSFFGTSPGSDSSDSFEPDAFVSPSSSPAWGSARRRPSYEKCNGHSATPLLHNGSAHPPKEYGSVHALWEDKPTHRENGSAHTPSENGSAFAPDLNGSAHQMIENGCVRPVWEIDCLQTVLDKEHAQNVEDGPCAHSVVENGSVPSILKNGSDHILDCESAHNVLQEESAHTNLGNGSALRLNEDDVAWNQMNNFSSENICNSESHIPENEDFWGQNNIEDAANDEAVNTRNVLNLERENDSARFTDLISSLQAVSVNESDDNSDHVVTENDATETESGLYSDNMFNESASLYVPHEEEIELLPSETFNNESPFNTREREDELDSGFRFNDDWEDRFSDYSLEDAYAEDVPENAKSQEKEGIREEVREGSDASTNLNTCQNDSSYQSTFCTVANLTLECSPEVLKTDRLADEKMPSVLEDLGVLPRRPSWEEIQKNEGPRLTSALIINQEDNLKEGVQVPEISSSESVEPRPECETHEAAAPSSQDVCCCSPPPQVVCDHTPDDDDDEEESEEESSREEDAEKLRPEPRRRRRPQAEEEAEEDEDEDSPRRRLRRCSSLKTGKTPPGTPHRKKIVRFADVLGLDLADVRTFLDEIPRIPSSAYDDLPGADLSLGSLANPVVAAAAPVDPAFSAVAGPDPSVAMALSLCAPCKTLVPTFQQPGGQAGFLERIRTHFVCVENAVVNDAATSSIAGVVRVRNLDFHKSVYVRYSIDGWKSYSDLQATYMPNSCDGFSDKFSFVLFAHTLAVGQRLEFAVRFQCKGTQYWDSNGGNNYGFQCLPATSPAPYMPLPSPEDRWGSFY